MYEVTVTLKYALRSNMFLIPIVVAILKLCRVVDKILLQIRKQRLACMGTGNYFLVNRAFTCMGTGNYVLVNRAFTCMGTGNYVLVLL